MTDPRPIPVEVEPPHPPPAWLCELMDYREEAVSERLSVTRRDGRVLVDAAIADAAALDRNGLRQATAKLYRDVRTAAESAGGRFPLRFWNFLPGIHDDMGAGMDRYRVFNAGRHDAMQEWLEGTAQFDRRMPTATGVGHRGRDLRVYLLAGTSAGEPVENPRQRPAYRYSDRYGPLPPCFARATLLDVDSEPTLLVGGTASVRGELSVHVDSLDRQLDETFENLASLVDEAAERSRVQGPARPPREYTEMRAYYVDPGDAGEIRRRVAERFPTLQRLEMMRADICRADLLVEIEGVARGS